MSFLDKKEDEVELQEEVIEEFVEAAPTKSTNTQMEIAYISASTVIDGNIKSDGHVIINGDVKGETNAKGDVVSNGRVVGNISCDSFLSSNASHKSNIRAINNVVIKQGTKLDGDIDCKNVTVYGTVNGNITAKGSVVLKSSAVVKGNITSPRLGMESGAVVEGAVVIK